MKELIKTLQEIDTITCRAMKEWDGIDIAKIPKEFHGYREILAKVDLVLSRHSAEVEPLAVLADRKGYWIDTNQHRLNTFRINLFRYQQSVGLHDCQMHEPKEIKAPTYAEAESKARQYLEGLPDKEGV